jgi:hypothetical protein
VSVTCGDSIVDKTQKPMSAEERLALLRMPITRGILATRSWGTTFAHAGNGERPALPVYGRAGAGIVGSRARRLSDGTNGL